eukprot:GHVL01025100.1.p1 GENE.GHVL01025100.1~~GHVL01025100.1.p1  ORF type:complete len:184 (+),score=34.72 GHVL01025100.1:43-594(+)
MVKSLNINQWPNILVIGTPGVGKSTFCQHFLNTIKGDVEYDYIDIGKLVEEKHLYEEWDDEFNCSIFSEEMIEREICKTVESSSKPLLFDFHSCLNIFQTSWLDIAIVLRAEISILNSRLTKRSYGKQKIKENIQSEIFQIALDEVREMADDQFEILEMENDSMEMLEKNIKQLTEIVSKWKE